MDRFSIRSLTYLSVFQRSMTSRRRAVMHYGVGAFLSRLEKMKGPACTGPPRRCHTRVAIVCVQRRTRNIDAALWIWFVRCFNKNKGRPKPPFASSRPTYLVRATDNSDLRELFCRAPPLSFLRTRIGPKDVSSGVKSAVLAKSPECPVFSRSRPSGRLIRLPCRSISVGRGMRLNIFAVLSSSIATYSPGPAGRDR